MMEVLHVLYLNLKIHILIMTALHTNFVIITFCKEPSGSHASTWLRNRKRHGYKLQPYRLAEANHHNVAIFVCALSALQSVHHSGPDRVPICTHLLHLPGIIIKVQLDVS